MNAITNVLFLTSAMELHSYMALLGRRVQLMRLQLQLPRLPQPPHGPVPALPKCCL